MENKEFIRIDEAAAFLGLTRESMYNLIARKAMPHYKPNEKTLY